MIRSSRRTNLRRWDSYTSENSCSYRRCSHLSNYPLSVCSWSRWVNKKNIPMDKKQNRLEPTWLLMCSFLRNTHHSLARYLVSFDNTSSYCHNSSHSMTHSYFPRYRLCHPEDIRNIRRAEFDSNSRTSYLSRPMSNISEIAYTIYWKCKARFAQAPRNLHRSDRKARFRPDM